VLEDEIYKIMHYFHVSYSEAMVIPVTRRHRLIRAEEDFIDQGNRKKK
jgi:hypothetical protein